MRRVERLFEYAPAGSMVSVGQCSNRFKRILRTVFQGIHVAKHHLAETAAEIFNQALVDGNQAIRKFISMGLEAVACWVRKDQLVLELRSVGCDSRVVTLCDAPSAFVAR